MSKVAAMLMALVITSTCLFATLTLTAEVNWAQTILQSKTPRAEYFDLVDVRSDLRVKIEKEYTMTHFDKIQTMESEAGLESFANIVLKGIR